MKPDKIVRTYVGERGHINGVPAASISFAEWEALPHHLKYAVDQSALYQRTAGSPAAVSPEAPKPETAPAAPVAAPAIKKDEAA